MILTFEINPVAKGRPRFSTKGGFPRAYTPLKTLQFEKDIHWLAKQQWKQPPLSGAVKVDIIFYLPIKNKKLWGELHTKKPDLDNLIKNLLDSLNGILYRDDAQIYEIRARKHYTEKGRITLEIEESQT